MISCKVKPCQLHNLVKTDHCLALKVLPHKHLPLNESHCLTGDF
ncbi:MAG: hypothetical protein ACJA0V_000523 [Planctomycetota bacterium]|jgi:hypothetical protein